MLIKTMWFPKQSRVPFLAIIFSMILLAVGKIYLNPTPEKYSVNPSVLPEKVKLPGWELEKTEQLPQQEIDAELSMAVGRSYLYTQSDQNVNIEMRYFYPETSANVEAYINRYILESPSLEIRQQPGIGFYAVFSDEKTAYLSACINPRGESTVTMKQFFKNRYTNDLHLGRFGAILVSREAILDRRCLWATLSVPLENNQPETAYEILEKAWFSWYEQWEEMFPTTM